MSTFSVGTHKSFLILIFFMVVSIGWSLRGIPNHVELNDDLQEEAAATAVRNKKEEAKEEFVLLEQSSTTGSSIPDCSHACGPCFPCKRVMVSFKCSSIAESCPIVYRCICKGKYYHSIDKVELEIRCKEPPDYWVKLNTDNSFSGNQGKAGRGGVVRNNNGRWVAGFTHNLGHYTTLALWMGSICSEIGIA
ncbi:hypothetical protein PIB30_043295 [Stylosanthes scabra]|uniref:Epidermal patterning factor-like protein n=1 Tax=Stylosanthes scabra TaxID=79078 RepID=A0ABU6YCV5_9FABA|nr:hypothetical protein [Stylosanthes scabra]